MWRSRRTQAAGVQTRNLQETVLTTPPPCHPLNIFLISFLKNLFFFLHRNIWWAKLNLTAGYLWPAGPTLSSHALHAKTIVLRKFFFFCQSESFESWAVTDSTKWMRIQFEVKWKTNFLLCSRRVQHEKCFILLKRVKQQEEKWNFKAAPERSCSCDLLLHVDLMQTC